MKNILLFISIFVIQANLFSLKLVKEMKLERINNQPYSYINSLDYDFSTKQLILATVLSNITSNTQVKTTDKSFVGVFMFSNKGKLLGKVGKFNSYDKDGIVYVHRVKILDNLINISDYSKKKLIIFSDKKPFNFLYSIDNIVQPVRAQIDFVKNNIAFFMDTNNYKIDSKDIRVMDKFMRVAIGKVTDTNQSELKQITDVKRLYSFKKDFNLFWNDQKLMKNSVIKKHLKKWRKLETKDVSLFELGAYRLGPNFTMSATAFDDMNNFYIINAFGTDINYYNPEGTLLDSFKIKKYEDFKLQEMALYKEKWLKELKNKKQLDEFRSKYHLSFAYSLIYDKNAHNIVVRYFLKDLFGQIYPLPKSSSYLLIYSLDKHKAISDFIPVDFIPIKIDSEKKQLVGVQQRDGDIYLQFYKWEY